MYTLWIWEWRSFVMTCSWPRLMSLMSPRLRFLFIKPSLMWGMCGSCVYQTETGRKRSGLVSASSFPPYTANLPVCGRVSGWKLEGRHDGHRRRSRIIKFLLLAWHQLLWTCFLLFICKLSPFQLYTALCISCCPIKYRAHQRKFLKNKRDSDSCWINVLNSLFCFHLLYTHRIIQIRNCNLRVENCRILLRVQKWKLNKCKTLNIANPALQVLKALDPCRNDTWLWLINVISLSISLCKTCSFLSVIEKKSPSWRGEKSSHHQQQFPGVVSLLTD